MVLLNLLLFKVFIFFPHQRYSTNSRTSPIPSALLLRGGEVDETLESLALPPLDSGSHINAGRQPLPEAAAKRRL